jgi:sugar lactone lactonase YvrE
LPVPERILRFDPATGAVAVLSEGGLFTDLDGIALAADAVYAADHGDASGTPPAILRVDATTGAQSTVTTGGSLVRPIDVAVESAGTLVVLDGGTGSGAKLVRVQPADGAQTVLVAPGALGPSAGGVAVDPDGTIVVVDGFGALRRVAPGSGAVTPLPGGPGLVSSDLALEPDGDAVVLVGTGADRVDRIDRATGAARTLATGFTSPVGVAVAPTPTPFCDTEVSRPTYVDGQIIRVSTLRISNPLAANFATRLRLELAVPGFGAPIALLNLSATLPARLDAELAPFAIALVDATLPRGSGWEFRCALEDPNTGAVQAQNAAPFALE